MVQFNYKNHQMMVVVSSYTNNGNLYVGLEDEEKELLDMTVNLDMILPPNQAFIDTNNFPDATMLINNNQLGKFTGRTAQSGFCTYPLYEFDMERLRS